MKITLVKEETQAWVVEVVGATATFTWGKVDGKQQVQSDVYAEGKQKRDADGQARFEALAAAKKKVRLGYCLVAAEGLTSEEEGEFKAAEAAFHVSPAPMLALELDAKRRAKLPPAVRRYVQKKLDGNRCLANLDTGALYSRGRKPMDLAHISAAVLALRPHFPPSITWLDGEVYKHGLSFQTVNSLAKGVSHTTKGDSTVLQYHVYDVVSPAPFSKRLDALVKAAVPDDESGSLDPVLAVKTHLVAVDADMDALHAQYVGEGYEGTILRIDGVGYEEDKRSPSLLKRKDWQQEEFSIVTFEKETLLDTLGAVLLEDEATGIQFSATPATTDAAKREMWERRDEYVGQKASVRFFGRHDSGVPRIPILVGFRDADDMGLPDMVEKKKTEAGAGAGAGKRGRPTSNAPKVKKAKAGKRGKVVSDSEESGTDLGVSEDEVAKEEDAEPVKRGRGRPSSKPAKVEAEAEDGEEPVKRGRGRPASKTAKVEVEVEEGEEPVKRGRGRPASKAVTVKVVKKEEPASESEEEEAEPEPEPEPQPKRHKGDGKANKVSTRIKEPPPTVDAEAEAARMVENEAAMAKVAALQAAASTSLMPVLGKKKRAKAAEAEAEAGTKLAKTKTKLTEAAAELAAALADAEAAVAAGAGIKKAKLSKSTSTKRK